MGVALEGVSKNRGPQRNSQPDCGSPEKELRNPDLWESLFQDRQGETSSHKTLELGKRVHLREHILVVRHKLEGAFGLA